MDSTRIRRFARTAAPIAALLLAGCQTHPPGKIAAADLQRSRDFALFTFYWVGENFHGIDLTAADSPRDYDKSVGMRVYYGDCRKPASILASSGCQLPLEIATVYYVAHHNDGLGPRREAVIRGVPAEIFNNGSSIELYTGHLAIDIYAQSPSLALAAANGVVPLNRSRPPTANLAPATFPPDVDPRIKALADSLPPPGTTGSRGPGLPARASQGPARR